MSDAKQEEIISYNSKHEGNPSPQFCMGSNKRCLVHKPKS